MSTVAPGTEIHLRDEGPKNGFPVVLLHGSNASLHTWEPWRERLVAKGYRVISFDFPAHGLSRPGAEPRLFASLPMSPSPKRSSTSSA